MTETDVNERAVVGDNKPPLEEQLAVTHAALVGRVEPIALRANKLPKKITTEADLELITPVVVDAKALSKELEAARALEKDPHFKAGKTVDAFFKVSKDRLDRIATVFEQVAAQFQRDKMEAERIAGIEEQRRADAEAERLRKKAEAAVKPETKQKHLDAADRAEGASDRAAAGIAQSDKAIGTVATSAGKVSGKKFWNFAIEDFDKVDLNAIRDFVDRAAIEKAIKAKIGIQKGNTKIDGVRVFEDVKASIR
jgi:hypothetical protein